MASFSDHFDVFVGVARVLTDTDLNFWILVASVDASESDDRQLAVL